jgi:hypothetical protein
MDYKMTDLEISKALAVAIGHRIFGSVQVLKDCWVMWRGNWRTFDYRDWNVIGPIAERYECFPEKYNQGWYAWVCVDAAVMADTPQKAIALAVIGAAK